MPISFNWYDEQRPVKDYMREKTFRLLLFPFDGCRFQLKGTFGHLGSFLHNILLQIYVVLELFN